MTNVSMLMLYFTRTISNFCEQILFGNWRVQLDLNHSFLIDACGTLVWRVIARLWFSLHTLNWKVRGRSSP